MTSAEIVEMYEDGELTHGEALDQIADLAGEGDIAETLRALPLMWRKEVELHIFYMFDNGIDSDDYIHIGRDTPDLDLRRRRIAALRAWIAIKRGSAPLPRDDEDA